MPCRGRIALVFQSLLEICPLFSRTLAWRSVDCLNRNRRIDPKTFRLGFSDTSFFSEVLAARSLARRNPVKVQFSQELQHPWSSLFPFWELFLGFFLGWSSTLLCANRISPALPPDSVYRIDIRVDANIQKVISYKYFSNSICTVVEEFCQSDFCFWRSFFLTCFYLVSLMDQRVERLSVSVLVHDHCSHAGNCTGLP